MDEGIKRIFREYIADKTEEQQNVEHSKYSSGYKAALELAMHDVILIYSRICGITYETAAAELREGDANDED